MEEEASKFGLHVSWPKTKVQNLGSGRGATDISVNGHTVGAVDDFIYLGSMQSCHSNSRPECLRRLGITATVMQMLERVWSQQHLIDSHYKASRILDLCTTSTSLWLRVMDLTSV